MLGAPTAGQLHTLIAVSPIIAAPVIGQPHRLAAVGFDTAATDFGTPKVGGVGPFTLVGDEITPANVTICTTANHCIVADGITKLWRVRGFKLQAATSGHGLVVANRGIAQVQSQGYKITGGAQRHWQVEPSGTIEILGVTVTPTGGRRSPSRSQQLSDHAAFSAPA